MKRVLILFDKTKTLVISEQCDLSQAELNAVFQANPSVVGPNKRIQAYNCALSFANHDHLQLAMSIASKGNMSFDPSTTDVKSVTLP